VVPVRPEELLLPGHAEELPDQPVRRADRLQRLARRRAGGRLDLPGRDRAGPHGGGHRQVHPRRRSTGRIHGADYSLVDYNRAGIPLIEIVTKPMVGLGERAPEVAKAYVATLRDLLRALGVSDVKMEQGRCAATPTSRCAQGATTPGREAARGPVRHPHRDQERQLAALGRAGGALRDDPARRGAGRRRVDPAGDPALARGHRGHDLRPGEVRRRGLPLLPRARPGADRARRREWVEAAAGDAARAAGAAPPTAAGEWGFSDLEMRDVVNAGAVETHRATVAAGATPPVLASGGRARSPAAPMPTAASWPTWASRPARRRARRLVQAGRLNDSMARQVLDGVLAGRGYAGAVADARGLALVSDDGALGAAVDEVIAANPDLVEKIRPARSRPPARSSVRS
jgi:aspartyl-tRNA(Asn)/glutamyl-tRNA(Gln) amidotransferase subunit B